MHSTVLLMSLGSQLWFSVIPDLQAVPPVYSYQIALSSFPCSSALSSPLHIIDYSLPFAIYYHPPSLLQFFFTYLTCNSLTHFSPFIFHKAKEILLKLHEKMYSKSLI